MGRDILIAYVLGVRMTTTSYWSEHGFCDTLQIWRVSDRIGLYPELAEGYRTATVQHQDLAFKGHGARWGA
jgi:hypothetical protein